MVRASPEQLKAQQMQEAKDAAQNAIPLAEGTGTDDLRIFYDLLAVSTSHYLRASLLGAPRGNICRVLGHSLLERVLSSCLSARGPGSTQLNNQHATLVRRLRVSVKSEKSCHEEQSKRRHPTGQREDGLPTL